MTTEFQIIANAISSSQALRKFVDQGGLTKILTAIGAVEYRAAILAVEGATKANDPASQLRLAIGHLQSSHIAHSKTHEMSGGVFFVLWPRVFKNACIQDCYSCTLMSLCYAYLKEPILAREALELAKVASTKYNDNSLSETMATFNIDILTAFFPSRADILYGKLPEPEYFDEYYLPKIIEIAKSD